MTPDTSSIAIMRAIQHRAIYHPPSAGNFSGSLSSQLPRGPDTIVLRRRQSRTEEHGFLPGVCSSTQTPDVVTIPPGTESPRSTCMQAPGLRGNTGIWERGRGDRATRSQLPVLPMRAHVHPELDFSLLLHRKRAQPAQPQGRRIMATPDAGKGEG